MNVGKTILSIRKDRELSQEEFGKLFHVTRQTISNWENEKSFPDLQTLIDMSDMFEISLDKLLKEDVQMVKSIDKQKKYMKIGKALMAVICMILVAGAVYAITWNVKKTTFEKKFEAALEKYEFIQNKEMIRGKLRPANRYTKESGNITYTVYSPKMPKITERSFKIPSSKKFISASCEKGDNIIWLRVDNETNLLTFFKKGTDASGGDKFINDILIGDDGIKNNIKNEEIKRIYDAMKQDIQTALPEMKKMYSNFY